MKEWIAKKKGRNFDEHLLRQYALFVDSSEQLTKKRQTTNQFYIGLHTLLLGFAGYLVTIHGTIVPFMLAVMGIVISCLWQLNINSYRRLNAAKFKVIHALEEHLPAKLFQYEEKCLEESKYFHLTSIERLIPFIVGICYLGIIVLLIF